MIDQHDIFIVYKILRNEDKLPKESSMKGIVIAAARKDTLHRESDFCGAMDGACKFLYGNGKFGILIIAICIMGGIFIDTQFMVEKINAESINNALRIYIPLSIGSGIFFTFHTFLLSLSAGIFVTRTAI